VAEQQTTKKEPTGIPFPRLDINQASQGDFAQLPGLGPELARRIIAYRNKHGRFQRVEDLLAIRGIGPKKWRALRPYLRVAEKGGP
jgi:competence protein ComEA